MLNPSTIKALDNVFKIPGMGDVLEQVLGVTMMKHRRRQRTAPAPEAKLWRYMDFVKYISMLSNGGLFFTNGTKFADKFEGALASEETKDVCKAQYIADFKKSYLEKDGLPKLTDDELDAFALTAMESLVGVYNHTKASSYISCWHENPGESEAMWKLYAKDFDNAIAIQTTTQRLRESITDPVLRIERVDYSVDYTTTFPEVQDTFWYKRPSFEHEREVRAVFRTRPLSDKLLDEYPSFPGVIVPANLKLLIERVYVSEYAGKWFVDLVKEVSQKYGLEVEVVKSSFCQVPW